MLPVSPVYTMSVLFQNFERESDHESILRSTVHEAVRGFEPHMDLHPESRPDIDNFQQRCPPQVAVHQVSVTAPKAHFCVPNSNAMATTIHFGIAIDRPTMMRLDEVAAACLSRS